MQVRRMVLLLVSVVLLVGAVSSPDVTAAQQTIPLNLSLGNALSLNATITVQQASIQGGQLVVTGSISGTATVEGQAATINPQQFTLQVSATCAAGTGKLTVNTRQIVLSLANGTSATVSPLTLTATAACGQKPTLSAVTSPVTVTVSDGTTLSVSEITTTLSSRANTQVGKLTCTLHDLICQLADLLASNGSATDAVSLLNQILSGLGI